LQRTHRDIRLNEVRFAVDRGIREYRQYMKKVQSKGQEFVERAREEGKRIIVLAGRPYHVDPETNHGISKLITEYGVIVLSEDSISNLASRTPVDVLDQWTYHSRMYSVADYIGSQDDMELVQLVSFGCGLDAITSDEIKAILEEKGKIYTQLKIDEITNLGAVRIRIRSLLSALEQKEKEEKAHGRKSW
jgi:predicted nucleotide-binding protein (sugar kinase/HSP70/actin superfamily)